MRILMTTGGSSHSDAALRFGLQILQPDMDLPTLLTVVRRAEDRPRGQQLLEQARRACSPIPSRLST